MQFLARENYRRLARYHSVRNPGAAMPRDHSSSWRRRSNRCRNSGDRPGVLNPVVALLFELEGELLSAGFHDSATGKYVHIVRHYVVEEALVVSDEDRGVLR